MTLTIFLIQCLNALQYGLLLFLVASGLTLIFGIMGVINLAHGSFYMIGAYMAYALAPVVASTFGGGFFSTLAVGLVLAVLLGYLLEWAFFSFLYEREHLQQVLMTYGLILVFEELRSLIVGDDVHGVAPPPLLAGTLPLGELMTYPVYRLFISGVCLVLALGMYLVFTRTRLGMTIRAGSSNREMVQSLGVDIKFLYRVVFAAGVAIAVLAVLLGYLLEWAFFSFLYRRVHLQQVLMTYGLILVFEELRSLLLGDDVHGVPAPPLLAGTLPLGETMTYPVYRLFLSGVCLLLALGMYFVFTRTRLGMTIRAGSTGLQQREMVQSLGIDIGLLYRIVFAAGVAIAVFAGMVAAPVSSVYPGMGNTVLIVCFVVVVIGGIGSIRGALLAALLIGFVDTFGKVLLPQAAGVLVYVLMALILLWKPDGLFKAG